MTVSLPTPALFLFAASLASCGNAATGDSGAARSAAPFTITELATFDEPWALAVDPGTGTIFVTEKAGRIKFVQPGGTIGAVTGVPTVDYGGQGGLGDFVFAPGSTGESLDGRTVYLSWAEAGDGDTRGAAVGRARLHCMEHDSCALDGLAVIWRQAPKVTGRGHYSHRLLFAPDGRHLYIASGDRQKFTPAQDMTGNLGKIVRLNPDGTPATGNPFAAQGGVAAQVWSLGHRNILGLAFDARGRLWDIEHGPKGGDEINLVRPGGNYGWPVVSQGDHYDGRPIPRHPTRPQFAAPAVSWTPVIAPGAMVIYRGAAFPGWRGNALVAAMTPGSIVRVAFDGERAREVARYPMERRIRGIAEDRDGSLLVIEDGAKGRLLRLRPAR